MAGTLSRSKPRPVTGVVATTWNAGIWGAGAGAEGREGAGAETRVDGAERAGLAAGAARRARTGAGRGAVTVTSGSVAATCPQGRFRQHQRADGDSLQQPATSGAKLRRTSVTPTVHGTRPHEYPQPTVECPLAGVPGCFGNSDLEHLAMWLPGHTYQSVSLTCGQNPR
jgi:hypothetical protein